LVLPEFDPNRQAALLRQSSSLCEGATVLIAIPYQNGWAYRIDYPTIMAETIVSRAIERRNSCAARIQAQSA